MPASRSLIALLVGTVAFFALWLIALKPSGSSSNGSSHSQGLGQYQSAINQAHQAVQTSNTSNAASGKDPASPSASSTAPATSTSASGGASASSSTSSSSHTTSSRHSPAKAARSHAARKPVHLTAKVAKHSRAAMARLSTVQHAVNAHKIVVMLFYNPAGADDQAVKQQLSAVPSLKGRVVKLTIPLSESANFTPVTEQVPINFSPTVVLISPDGQAQTIPGLSDSFVITQYVRDAALAK